MSLTARLCRLVALLLLAGTLPATAQLPPPNAMGVTTGHIHYTVPDRARYMDIWQQLGGEVISLGPMDAIRFPGIYILMNEGTSEAPSTDTTANHIGFSIKDYAFYHDKLEEIGATFFFESPQQDQILADLPDGIRLEILVDAEQEHPIQFHHIHLVSDDLPGLQAWYLKVFGAEAGERRGLPSALIPGGRVDIMGVSGGGEKPRGSRGGALDHIGFDVADMDAFAAHLAQLGIAFEVPPAKVEGSDAVIAFLTDPGGTYIEITQGLAKLNP
ncbi:MAG TPA: VOC family protein [Hyphomicrobiales bacterium]|nr:VOC family protein [Hyphomicrobiales bacterium]